MTRIESLIITVFLFIPAFLWGQGVDFRDLDFQEALRQARAEKKMVLVDCYTSWCGPCRYMMNEIFPKPEAGDYFNSRFVCVKYDMEKGEGKKLNDGWKVKAFPTFFIFTPNGEVQHKLVGASGILENFIIRVDRGLHKKTSFSYLDRKYAGGKMKKDELLAYYHALNDAGEDEKSLEIKNKVASMLTDKDKLKKEFWFWFEEEECVVGTHDFNLILSNVAQFEKNIGKEKLDAYLYKSYCPAILFYLTGKVNPHISLDELKRQVSALDIARKQDLQIRLDFADCVADKDIEKLWEKLDTPSLAEDVLWDGITVVQTLEKDFSQEDYRHFADWLERKMQETDEERMKESLGSFFEFYAGKVYRGVDFRNISFEEALKQASQEGKMVFIDCYTTWCGPCKYMAEKIFPLKEAGDYFNSRFVCVKFDMDQEGRKWRKEWHVEAYPCFLIFQPDGTMLHQFTGSRKHLDEFIARIENGLKPQNSMHYLQTQYENGIITNQELLAYQFVLQDARRTEEAKKIHEELMNKLTDEEKLKKEFWPIFEEDECTVGTHDFNLLLAHIPVFEKNVGKEKLDEYLYERFSKKLAYYIGDWKMEMPLENVKQQIQKLNIAKKTNLLLLSELAQCVNGRTKNKQKLFRVLENNIPAFYGKELEQAFSALQSFKEQWRKQDYEKIIVWLEKVAENPQNKSKEVRIEMRLDSYRGILTENVYFRDLSLNQALEKAQIQDKKVFMYCYSSSDESCKEIESKLFPEKEVRDYLNSRFICVKYDLEQTGMSFIKEKYQMESYPSFLILEKDGSVLLKFSGKYTSDAFIDQVSKIYAK